MDFAAPYPSTRADFREQVRRGVTGISLSVDGAGVKPGSDHKFWSAQVGQNAAIPLINGKIRRKNLHDTVIGLL